MLRRALLAVCLIVAAPGLAEAQAPLLDGLGGSRGFGDDCLSPNDDGSSNVVDLTEAFPGGLDFFGARHTTAYVNTNGNITFSGPVPTFTPTAFPVADRPMIAPYWADVDIRSGSSCDIFGGGGGGEGCSSPSTNGVWWHLEPGRMVVTWDQVGYFSCDERIESRKMSFQLIISDGLYCGTPGDFDVEFRYNRCEWETGNASDGVDGFGGTQAQVGFDAGDSTNFVSIMGSRMAGISRVVCDDSNVGIPGVWQFRIRRGSVECPDAGELCDTGEIGVCGQGRTQCRGATVVCESVLTASDERCDALDNDCDGSVDEGTDLCPDLDVCDRGRCIEPCFEGGCGPGETCTEGGSCTEDACATVSCAAGERCIGGDCIDVCADVVCPAGQSCRAGRCLDLCEGLTCGACNVCSEGACQSHCLVTGCAIGSVCEENGLCVEDACLGVRCGPGRACLGGRCANACVGVICPMAEMCRDGECVPMGLPEDAGVLPTEDAGPRVDAGTPGSDAGMMDAGVAPADAGGPPPDDDGCSCRAAGIGSRPERSSLASLLCALAFGIFIARRRAGAGR